MRSAAARMVAMLHGVVEGAAWTLEQRRPAGVTDEVVAVAGGMQRSPATDRKDSTAVRCLRASTDADTQWLHQYRRAWLALRQAPAVAGGRT